MILFVDCYDSFSYNLTRLIASTCSNDITVVHNDQITSDQLAKYLPFIDAIILGPGPGDPHNPRDRGVIADIWKMLETHPVPVFGVCFGYQSMVLAYDGNVERMSPPQHGRVGLVEHDGTSKLLSGIPSPFEAVRYHSLHSIACDPLICTARDRITTPFDETEMAAEHKELPIFGVQFHPESVLSTYGEQIFKNFWAIAKDFNATHRNVLKGSIPQNLAVSHTPLLQNKSFNTNTTLSIKEIPFMDWKQIAANLDKFVVCKSASFPGEWSIFGVLEPGITPHIRSKNNTVYEGPLKGSHSKMTSNVSVWEAAARFMESKLISRESAELLNQKAQLPFLGGLMGYISYEGGCHHTVDTGSIPLDSGLNSDVSLVFVTKALLINETTKKTYLVGPSNWTESVKFQEIELQEPCRERFGAKKVSKMDFPTYEKAVSRCFEKLKAGDSYELCLTTQTQVELEADLDPWSVFVHLIDRNPAPYCSYMAFDDTLVATSPERFMSWDHEGCEFRPIKGTVRKSPTMTKEKASEILRTPKEQAENLMIVDLIRHDLGHLLEDVSTPQLMVVEEYHSVYQLVTSVEGKFQNREKGGNQRSTGIDVLSQSLPPGSMTGAPKQRSVEILRGLETQPRGLYSGVHGYWSIDDRGDWSVIIRSLFRSKHDPTNLWRLGAGGAVTALSTAEGEYDEMNTKMNSVLDAFV